MMNNVIFYDGDCVLCSRFMRIILEKDTNQILYFTSLQSEYSHAHLGEKTQALNTIYYQSGEKLFYKSDAVFQIFYDIKRFRPIIAILRLVPKALRNSVYDLVAKNRHRFYPNTCSLPVESHMERLKIKEI